MDRDTFSQIVDEAIDTLPQWAVDSIDNLRILIEERPTDQQHAGPDDLLGLYDGIPLQERGPDYVAELPDTIFIFREPHLALNLSPDELRVEIQRTVLHELAHYFGIDDERLEQLGWD
ncbi:MAG: metallopeptidase family protein [Gammaproteobacteria bacterium]